MADADAPIGWTVRRDNGVELATFVIRDAGGLLRPEQLPTVELPNELLGRERAGIVFSGRGPIWLFCHLAHLAHPFAWVAVHDPRLGGAVVVQRHRPDAPALGEIVPL